MQKYKFSVDEKNSGKRLDIFLVDNFKKAFQDVFGRIKNIYMFFKKANKPLLLISAELEEFKRFSN